MTHHIDLETLTIKHGSHAGPGGDGGCLLEWVSAWDGQPWSDHDPTVDPRLAVFGTIWNDSMRTNREREQLRQYIPLLGGTNHGPALSERRAWMAVDWLVRANAPQWLRLAGGECAVYADTLAALPPILNSDIARQHQPIIDNAPWAAWASWLAGAPWAPWAPWAAWAAWAPWAPWAAWAAWASWLAWAPWAAGAGNLDTITAVQASTHDLFHRMIEAQ